MTASTVWWHKTVLLHHYVIYYYNTIKITCRSESMPSKLRRRLRSTVSPFRSRSICSRIPSTVRLWTPPSLTMCTRNSSSPVSLRHHNDRTNSLNDRVSDRHDRLHCIWLPHHMEGRREFWRTYVRSRKRKMLRIMIWKEGESACLTGNHLTLCFIYIFKDN